MPTKTEGAPPVDTHPLEDELKQTRVLLALANAKLNLLDQAAGGYIERMAGEIVARGFLSIVAAHAWASEERAKVQAGLAAIEQAMSAQHGPEEVVLP